MGGGDVFRQLRECMEQLPNFKDGHVYFKDCDFDQLTWVSFEISPNDGVYSGAIFLFKVRLWSTNFMCVSAALYLPTTTLHQSILTSMQCAQNIYKQ